MKALQMRALYVLGMSVAFGTMFWLIKKYYKLLTDENEKIKKKGKFDDNQNQ